MTCILRSILSGILAGFLFVPGSFAQSTFGSITGTVLDPNGAAVPAADVVVTNLGTGSIRRVTSTSEGLFSMANLDLGTYSVRVSAQGFATYSRDNLVLTANQRISVEVELKVGTSIDSVEVNVPSPIISTETNDIASSIRGGTAESLPLIGRHAADTGIYTYATLATGTSTSAGSPLPIFQGVRSGTGVMATMDGISVAAYAQGAGPVSIGMSAVEEVKMETSVAPPEFPTAGNVQVVSKSGTNNFHGAIFEDYNGNALNTRSFFSSSVPWRVYHNFGASAGGPIVRNKIFFFANYEGAREAARATKNETVPLPAWRNGDFRSLSQMVKDPVTNAPFPGNVIPDSRISQVSRAVQDYIYPLPNNGPPGTLNNNWTMNVISQTGFTHYNRIDARVDYNATKLDTIFARVSWMRMPFYSAGVYPLARLQTRYAQSAALSYNRIISPNAVNEVRMGITYHRNYLVANVTGSDLLQRFGIQGVPTSGVKTAPYFGVTGLTAFDPGAGSNIYFDNPDTSFEWIDNLSWTRGRHMMKFGFDAIRERYNGNSINQTVYGVYNFTGAYTGVPYADFLLGLPQTTTLALPNPDRAMRGNTFGLYGQDQFRVNNSLTLTYGIRWELPQPYSDIRGQIYTYNPTTGSLVVPDKGAQLVNAFYPKNIPIVTASQAGYPANTLINHDLTSIEPRVGFALKLFGSDKLVLRGGYGIYANLIYSQVSAGAMTGGPFAGSQSYFNSITNGVPSFSFPSPFLPTGTTAVQNVAGVNPNLRTPYTQQWNLTIERQLGSIGLRASYAGSHTVGLLYQRNLNQPAPSTTRFSTALFPNQRFSRISYYDNGGSDSYNSLELLVQKRMGKNLIFNTGFTWAKDLTDTQDTGGGGGSFAGQLLQNQFCRVCERSNNQLVPSRRLYGYAVYSLPVGKGQQFLGNARGIVQAVLGGWQTSWTVVLQSGQYFTPSFSTFDTSNTGVIGGAPDRIAGAPLYPERQDLNHWFNPGAFAIPGCSPSTPICNNPANVGRFGTAGWNYLIGPPLRNLDFGLAKDFKVHERVTARFSLIMVNALNHPSFNTPNANISTPASVGVITGIRGALLGEPSARNIDFVFRLSF
jgi:carboxypeptidase family protein